MASGEGQDALEEALDRIEDLAEAEDLKGARKALRRALKSFPGEPSLLEWEASLLIEEERFDEALRVLDRILALEPDRTWALLEKPSTLMDLGRFGDALGLLRKLVASPPGDSSSEDRARVHHELGLCLDRAGDAREADAQFRRAERLSEEYPAPPRLSAREFDRIVAEALQGIPGEFGEHLAEVSVVVQDYPEPSDDPFLLGLYVGTPRTERTWDSTETLDRVFIFKRNHELMLLPEDELREEIRKTVVHEIAHHFGLDEGEMGYYA